MQRGFAAADRRRNRPQAWLGLAGKPARLLATAYSRFGFRLAQWRCSRSDGSARVTRRRNSAASARVWRQPMFSNVQSVEPGESGKVQIAVDEVQRRVVSGTLEDPRIQALLLSAVREESNPGVRVESIGMLKNSADSEVVRKALIDAVSHDPNAGRSFESARRAEAICRRCGGAQDAGERAFERR